MKTQCLAVFLTLSIAIALPGQAPPLLQNTTSTTEDILPTLPASRPAYTGGATDLFTQEPPSTSSPSPSTPELVTISYLEKIPVDPAAGAVRPSRIEYRAVNVGLEIDCDLEKLTLTGDGKRVAVQAITAARHAKLLKALKDAKSETEKEAAAKKLEENYRAHYAIETTWREERIAELEKRIEVMRAHVKERATSEDKYVEAAMTLAKLHAQGIAAEPPKLKNSNGEGEAPDSIGSIAPTLPAPALPAATFPGFDSPKP